MHQLDPEEAVLAAELADIRKRKAQLKYAEANHIDCLLTIMRGNGVKEALACVDGLAYHITYGVNIQTMEEEIRLSEHRYETDSSGHVVLVLSPEDLRL